MILSLFDVELRMLGEEDLELVRHWRNSDEIRQRMEYREEINKEQHYEWYKRMSDYRIGSAYIIVYQEKKIGLIYGKHEGNQSEGGMFIWEDEYLNTLVPVIVSLLITDLNFYFKKNKLAYIKILRDNTNSIYYNKKLGYTLCEGQEDKYNQLYMLTREHYEKSAGKLKKMLEVLYKAPYIVYGHVEQSDIDNGLIEYGLENAKGVIQLVYPKE